MAGPDTPLLSNAHILIVGGGSRIAAILARLLGGTARPVVRRPSNRASDIVVADYADIPDDAFRGISCVVNCVGIASGTATELQRINADTPRQTAIAAKAAGIGRFIHISSFSVYGGARAIGHATPVAPASDYGQSKLAGDEALLALADNRFAVTILRLPLIYGEGSLGKVGQLMRLWRRIRVLPVPAGDVSRAMIGTEMSAEVIARLCCEPREGIVFAADPQRFSYAGAVRARSEKLWTLPVPRVLTRLVERTVPAIGSRLFADSRLADADNLAVAYKLQPRLWRDLGSAALD